MNKFFKLYEKEFKIILSSSSHLKRPEDSIPASFNMFGACVLNDWEEVQNQPIVCSPAAAILVHNIL